jgi:hypothetical protein
MLLTACSTAAAVAMQAVAGQWFPPPISISQYGIGPHGWLFSVFVVTMGAAPLCFERLCAHRQRYARVILGVGLAGAVVMALVRTDSGGAQASVNAKVHMVGAIFCLFCVPLGMFLVLWLRGGRGRLVGLMLIVGVYGAIALLLAAAAGLDTAGLGPTRSWAFWQAVAAVVSMVMVATLAAVSRPRQRERASSR